MDNSNLVKRQTVKAGKAFQYCTFSPPIFFIWNTFSSHVLYSVHVSFYLNHFFPPMCFIPNMFLFIWSTFYNPCSLFQTYLFHLSHFFPPMVFIPDMFLFIWITFFHQCVLFQTCFFLFQSKISTHVFYSNHVLYLVLESTFWMDRFSLQSFFHFDLVG